MNGSTFRDYAIALTSPSAWIGLLLITGPVLLFFKKEKIAKCVFIVSSLLYLLFAYDPFTEALLNFHENKYKSFTLENYPQHHNIKYVVVLAGGYAPYPSHHSVTSELTRHTLVRTIEGIRIHRQIPKSKLIFSGKGWAPTSEARAMMELALNMGIKEDSIILEEESNNTFEHTLYLKDLVQTDPFVLVTSAMHMPRAMGLFSKAGLLPIPAPTGHLLQGEFKLFNRKLPFASGDNLEAIDFYFNEIVGLYWAKLNGKI